MIQVWSWDELHVAWALLRTPPPNWPTKTPTVIGGMANPSRVRHRGWRTDAQHKRQLYSGEAHKINTMCAHAHTWRWDRNVLSMVNAPATRLLQMRTGLRIIQWKHHQLRVTTRTQSDQECPHDVVALGYLQTIGNMHTEKHHFNMEVEIHEGPISEYIRKKWYWQGGW